MKKTLFAIMVEEIYNRDMYDIYINQVVEIIRSHNGEYVVRTDNILPFTGKQPQRCIIIAFDSMIQAKQCFFSKEYERIKPLRENSTKSRAFFIENH